MQVLLYSLDFVFLRSSQPVCSCFYLLFMLSFPLLYEAYEMSGGSHTADLNVQEIVTAKQEMVTRSIGPETRRASSRI